MRKVPWDRDTSSYWDVLAEIRDIMGWRCSPRDTLGRLRSNELEYPSAKRIVDALFPKLQDPDSKIYDPGSVRSLTELIINDDSDPRTVEYFFNRIAPKEWLPSYLRYEDVYRYLISHPRLPILSHAERMLILLDFREDAKFYGCVPGATLVGFIQAGLSMSANCSMEVIEKACMHPNDLVRNIASARNDCPEHSLVAASLF